MCYWWAVIVKKGYITLFIFICCIRNSLLQRFHGSLHLVRDYPGEPVPEETFTHSHLSLSSIILYLLLSSMASSLFNLCAWQSFCTTSLQVFFGLPLGLAPSTSYSINFLHPINVFFSHHMPMWSQLFCCSTEIISSNPGLSLNFYLELYLLP